MGGEVADGGGDGLGGGDGVSFEERLIEEEVAGWGGVDGESKDAAAGGDGDEGPSIGGLDGFGASRDIHGYRDSIRGGWSLK